MIRYRLNIQYLPTSYAVVFLYVCAFEFYRIFKRIGHLLDLLIFAAFNVGPFGLWPTHCADSIVQIASCGLHRSADCIVQIASCRLHRADCMCGLHRADCIVRIASWRAVSCGLHRGADCIVVRIASYRYLSHSIMHIPPCAFHPTSSCGCHPAGKIFKFC